MATKRTTADWATTPNALRRRPMVTLSLGPEELAALDAIAAEDGTSRSGAAGALAVAELDRRSKRATARKGTRHGR